jgi:glycosyltransferase involved in cell wall biosynthesis
MDGYRLRRAFLVPSANPREAFGALPRSARAVVGAADLLHLHGEDASVICLPVLAARRSVVTLHGLHRLRRSEGAKREVAKMNLRLILRAATRTICVSEAERDELVDFVGPHARSRIRVIRNGVELPPRLPVGDRAAARARLDLPASATVGVYVGSLMPHKDPLVAARAAAAVAREGASLTLVMAGDGPLRPDLERVSEEAGGQVLRLLGQRNDIQTILSAADFFVLPSHREGLSFAVLEAMSLGLASVVSDAPGNPEAVGDTGIVVPCGDVDGFAAAFRRLLDDEQGRAALGERARARVAEHFTAEQMVRGTRELYDEVIAVRPGRRGAHEPA